MILAFVMLAAGGILLGGAYSFAKQKKPMLAIIALTVTGLGCVLVAYWRIRMG
ncbi:hypothetical protein M3B90_07135 [Dermabacter sp. p3-SID358]|uniref:hypothetical protein n=1 Tax=Dermabacter sp. p3-SID358 TaxID=2916114 RepID=UPI0021A2D3CA|nr:hypothetical protein [Dermabacter sp. p3-SID358]MCT1867296.1 hypothetical protein [Dermabacter sp. p3-SID358]